MQNVLVPTDFSAAARAATAAAATLARRSGATITLLHVVDALPTLGGDSLVTDPMPANVLTDQLLVNDLLAQAEQELNKAADALRGQGVTVRTRLEVDRWTAQLRERVSEDGQDLVIMGTEVTPERSQLLDPSHAERVIRAVACPVLTCRQGAVFPPQRVALVTDGQVGAVSVAPAVAALRRWFDFDLMLLTVQTDAAAPASDAPLADYARHYALGNHTTHVVKHHDVDAAVGDFVKEHRVDLVAIATGGRGMLSRLFRPSVAEAVVEEVACSVLTVNHK